MIQKVIQVGNSLALIIPKNVASRIGWKKGQKVHVSDDPRAKTVTVSAEPLTDGLTPQYYQWKQAFLDKNKDLLTRISK